MPQENQNEKYQSLRDALIQESWDSVPPAVLLRATEKVPIPLDAPDLFLHDVDISRTDDFLGWNLYTHNFIKAVFNVEGNHYDIFRRDRVRSQALLRWIFTKLTILQNSLLH